MIKDIQGNGELEREYVQNCWKVLTGGDRKHFQELQLNTDLANFSQIWPDARNIYNQQNCVGEFYNSENSFLEGHFRAFTPHVSLAILKMFCNF